MGGKGNGSWSGGPRRPNSEHRPDRNGKGKPPGGKYPEPKRIKKQREEKLFKEGKKRSPEPTITPWGDRVLEEGNLTEQDTNTPEGHGR